MYIFNSNISSTTTIVPHYFYAGYICALVTPTVNLKLGGPFLQIMGLDDTLPPANLFDI